jgi:hypothetical protein
MYKLFSRTVRSKSRIWRSPLPIRPLRFFPSELLYRSKLYLGLGTVYVNNFTVVGDSEIVPFFHKAQLKL